ncbi:hypothetical protein F4778DRAFT_340883 [Xylariomycetidae sp. FL2044]|nr:hypothetical protein F4778DRAFT_340883 [Xylariomycetidae sp. FL2044]
MRLHKPAPLTALLTALSTLTAASPYPRDGLRDFGFGFLMPRACASYCGTDNQYCCSAGQACTTSAGVAACAAGEYDLYTTTWTETRTYTSTISSYYPGATTPASGGSDGQDCVPPEGSGQIACGPICCATNQYCQSNGQCMPNANAGSWTQWTTVGIVTTQFSAPYRPTGSATITSPLPTGTADSATMTSTGTAAPAPVASTGGSLSGGAIAGIVVGTLAGVVLLLLLCFCCIVRGLWNTVMGFFGLGGKKKSERVEVTEEHYSRHGSHSRHSAAAARPSHRNWFGGGGGGGRPSTAAPRKENKSGSGLGWLAAGAGAAALLLGLKRDNKRRASSHRPPPPPRSDWSSSYYTDSYTASSPSSLSTDRRTRDTRRSRQSRQSRTTRASRPSRV